MAKTLYEVRVDTVGVEFYAVRANSREEAMSIWSDGDMVGSEVLEAVAVDAVEEFDQDDFDFEEEYDDDDGYDL